MQPYVSSHFQRHHFSDAKAPTYFHPFSPCVEIPGSFSTFWVPSIFSPLPLSLSTLVTIWQSHQTAQESSSLTLTERKIKVKLEERVKERERKWKRKNKFMMMLMIMPFGFSFTADFPSSSATSTYSRHQSSRTTIQSSSHLLYMYPTLFLPYLLSIN